MTASFGEGLKRNPTFKNPSITSGGGFLARKRGVGRAGSRRKINGDGLLCIYGARTGEGWAGSRRENGDALLCIYGGDARADTCEFNADSEPLFPFLESDSY